MLGGLVADRWIGQRNAVVLGALAMAGGHLAMAFERSFLLALLLLVVGSGLLKGNISAQVGALYPSDDESLRTRGFAIFSTAINSARSPGRWSAASSRSATAGTYGFGIAAVFMLVGLATYLYGYRYLPARVARVRVRDARRLTARRVANHRSRSSAVMLITIFQSVSYYQLANVLPVWIQEHVDLRVGSSRFPIPWFQSIDALFSILAVPVLFGLWGYQASPARRARRPGEDRHGCMARRGEQPDPGVRHRRRARRARASDLAGALLRRHGRGVPLLLADAARARFACGAGRGQCHADGHGVRDALHLETT